MESTVAKAEFKQVTIELTRVNLAQSRKLYNIYTTPASSTFAETQEQRFNLGEALALFSSKVESCERITGLVL